MQFRHAFRVAVIAAASCAAVGVAVPGAAAVDLAPGVHCDGARCTNDNGEAYIVHGFVTCSVYHPPLPSVDPATPPPPVYTFESLPWSEVFEPHTTRDVNPRCAGEAPMGWTLAGAYPRSQVPTGSAIPGFG
jgi:hypothetical protein